MREVNDSKTPSIKAYHLICVAYSRFTEGLTVTIQLENTTKTFMVQRALLCSLSDYFTTALGGSFKEGRDNTLRLPGCDTETFKMFLYWACNRSLPEAPEPGKGTTPANQTFQFIMVKVWCFADAILLPQLQNDAMKALLDGLRYARVPVEAIRFTFENSANDSVLRKAILEEVI